MMVQHMLLLHACAMHPSPSRGSGRSIEDELMFIIERYESVYNNLSEHPSISVD